MKKIQKQTVWDLALFLLITGLCLICLFTAKLSRTAKKAEIYEDGKLVRTIALDEVRQGYDFPLKNALVHVEPGAIGYVKAACPDKLCVKTGMLHATGDTAACVPDKTVITVRSATAKHKLHAVTY